MKRTIFSFLAGIGISIIVTGAAWAWLMDRANDNTREIAPLLSEVIEAQDDPAEISRMKAQPKYNRFAVIWILEAALNAKNGNSKALENSVVAGSHLTDDYELFIFMKAFNDHVNGLSQVDREAYARAGALESFIELDMPSEFVDSWNDCRQRLADRYESWFGSWTLLADMAFPDTEPSCPALKQIAEKIAAI